MDPKSQPDSEEKPNERLSGGEPDAPPAEGEKDFLSGGPDDNCL